jgi:choline-sulfatase
MTDQQRMDSLGVYGGGAGRTPILDDLAAGGMRFDQAYTPCTVCSPARASVFTGRYPFEHGVVRNGADLRLELPNLAGSLREAGYRLGYTGKWHVDDVYGPTHFGFRANDWLGYSHPAGDLYMRSFHGSCKYPVNHYHEYLKARGMALPALEDVAYYPANPNFEIYARQTGPVEASFEHYVAEEAIELLERFADLGARDDRPFFTWVNFWGPHDPYILPDPWYSRYDGEDVLLSPSMEETWEHKPWIQRRMSSHYWGVDGMDEAVWREAVAKYAGYCAFIDWEVGRILIKLAELDLLDDTLIIFTSDHGSMVGRHKLIDKGPYPYDDIQRIPLIVSGPGIDAGQDSDAFVYLHDLTPTLLDWAGAPDFPTANAQSLRPLMRGEPLPSPRDDVYMVRHHHPLPCEQRFVRTRLYKYAYNALDVDELYDLAEDPHEMVNQIDNPAYAVVKADMQARMWSHMQELDDPIRGRFNTFAAQRRFR